VIKICEKNLIFSRGPAPPFASEDNYRCVFCSRFSDENDLSAVDIDIDIFTDKHQTGYFEHIASEIQLSVLASRSVFTYCEDLSLFSDQKNFPNINENKLQNENKNSHFEGKWDLSYNNEKILTTPSCSLDPNRPGKARCTFDGYKDFQFDSSIRKLGLLVKIPLYREQKTQIEDVALRFTVNNTSYNTFVVIFQAIFAFITAGAFTFLISQLQSYPTGTWLSLYKWTIAVLLAQIFLCNLPSILSLNFQNLFNRALSDLGQNLNTVLIFYFLISLLESLLTTEITSGLLMEWSVYVKHFLLIALFFLRSGSSLYSKLHSMNSSHDNSELRFIEMVISCLQICFSIYYMLIISVYIINIKLQKLESSGSAIFMVLGSTLSFFATIAPSLLKMNSSGGTTLKL